MNAKKRKRYSEKFKNQVIQETLEVENCSLVARRYEMNPNIVSRWVREYKQVFGSIQSLSPEELEHNIRQELAQSKQLSRREKVELARNFIDQGYNVKQVLEIFGIKRSTYYYHIKKGLETPEGDENPKGGRPTPGFSKNQAGESIADDQIKEWIMERHESADQYLGYNKITQYLQQERNLIINKKKVYRLCKELDIIRSKTLRKS